MNKRILLSFVSVIVVGLLGVQSPSAWAQHGHGHGHGGHGGGHGHMGGHYGGHGHGIGIGIHLGHQHVLPHISHHHHGSYWVDSGLYYYRPSTYVTTPGAYVVSKPATIEFGGYAHTEDLAGRLVLIANDLCLDMHYNYADNPGYAETYREAYQILDMAKYMQAQENQNNRSEIANRVQDLDPLFHHVQGEVRSWSRRHQKQVGEAGIMTKIEIMESLLHHLMYDAGIRPHEASSTETAPPPATSEVAPPPAEVAPPPLTSPPPSLP